MRSPGPSVLTDVVTSARLVDQFDLNGVLQPKVTFEVSGPDRVFGAARSLVTRMPLGRGDEVRPGMLLAEVSGRPVIALHGRFAAYRDLGEGDKGPDVRQLQSAIRDVLGWPRITGVVDRPTVHAVRRMYQRLGYEPILQPGPGEAQAPGGEASRETPGTSSGETPERPSVPSAPPVVPRQVLHIPAGEFTYLPAGASMVVRTPGKVGGEARGALLALATDDVDVVAPVTPEQAASLAVLTPEASIRLMLPDGARPVTFSRLGRAPTASGSRETPGPAAEGSGEPPAPANTAAYFTVPSETARGMRAGDRGRLRVELKRSPRGTLVVPLSAIFTDASGQTAVTVDPSGRNRKVEVEVVMMHAGRAAVTAGERGLIPGDKVLIGYQDVSIGDG